MDGKLLSLTKKITGFGIRILLIITFGFPFLWMFSTAFKSYHDSIAYPPKIFPSSIVWGNFLKVFGSGPFITYTINSIIVVVATMSLQFLILIPAAYSFARYKFKGRNILFGVVLIAFMVPNQVTFVPVYLLMAKLGLLRTLLPQILPFIANPFGIFLLRQSFMQIESEILESATIDGANEFKLIARIMLPIARPTIVTIALFSFINNWNSYFWPLVMTDTMNLRPLTVGLAMLKISEGTLNWPVVMAGNVFLLAPVIVLYAFSKNKILSSIGYDGIK